MFDIHQPLVNEYGEWEEDQAERYFDGLMDEFERSPEAKPLLHSEEGIYWPEGMMEYALRYLGQSVVDMTTADFEEAVKAADTSHYVLRLYVTGLTSRSLAAIEMTKRTCEEFLRGRYDLEVIDLSRHPALAEGEQIIAAPTLVRQLPKPLRRLVGDLSDQERVLFGLDLRRDR